MIPFLAPILGIGEKLIDRLWPDPEQRAKAKLEMMRLAQEGELRDLEAAMKVVVAEAQSKHSLTAMWRPVTMLSFVAIIVNNYIVAPYTSMLFGVSVVLEIPPDMWALLKLGVGGYVVGRSVEKSIETWKNNK